MCDQTEIVYSEGEVVWVKLGSSWWPGEVQAPDKVPPEALGSLRKPPIAIVKFFKEESFEFVRNLNCIYKYNCSRKHEFIKKGLDQYRSKHSHMELFPVYVKEAEERTDGDPDILQQKDFEPDERVDYTAIFASPQPTHKQGHGRGRPPGSGDKLKHKMGKSPENKSPNISHPRIIKKYLGGTSDYRVHYLVQEERREGEEWETLLKEEEREREREVKIATEEGLPTPSPSPSPSPALAYLTPAHNRDGASPYTCHACNFSCSRINVMVLHNKCHSASYIPYTPPKRPKPRPESHSTPQRKHKPSTSAGKPRGRPKKIDTSLTKPIVPIKRKTKEKQIEKPKTDLEIKNSLLADWSEHSDDSMDVLTSLELTENQKSEENVIFDRFTEDTATEDSNENEANKIEPNKLFENKELDDADSKKHFDNKVSDDTSKPIKSKKTSCFDFEDDDEDDLLIETIGRKIPRLSNKNEDAPKKVMELNVESVETSTQKDIKNIERQEIAEPSSHIDNVNLDDEINNLLQETVVPVLPSLPDEPKFIDTKVASKVQENEHVSDNDKCGDSKPQQKSIFKTKTFFRSRHSRSQDAIEKYVADNTSIDKPPTYMEEAPEVDPQLEALPKPLPQPDDATLTSPVSKGTSLKTPKFAPKIQLKKMKAALREKIKSPVKSVEKKDMELDIIPENILQEEKSNEDRWNNESVDNLLKCSSSEEKVQSSSTVNDLLGTMEELHPISHISSVDVTSKEEKVDKDILPVETPTAIENEVNEHTTGQEESKCNEGLQDDVSMLPMDNENVDVISSQDESLLPATDKCAQLETDSIIPHDNEMPDNSLQTDSPQDTSEVQESSVETTASTHQKQSSEELQESVVSNENIEMGIDVSYNEVAKCTDEDMSTLHETQELSASDNLTVLDKEKSGAIDKMDELEVLDKQEEISAVNKIDQLSDYDNVNELSEEKNLINDKSHELDDYMVSEKSDEHVPVDNLNTIDAKIDPYISLQNSDELCSLEKPVEDSLVTTDEYNNSAVDNNTAFVPLGEQSGSDKLSMNHQVDSTSSVEHIIDDTDVLKHQSVPTESDLQIAETLINLPTSGTHPVPSECQLEPSETVVDKDKQMTEIDQSFNAAKSLVQMSETLQSEQSSQPPCITSFSIEEPLEPQRVSINRPDPCIPLLEHPQDKNVAISESPKKISKVSPLKDNSIEHSKLFQILDEGNKSKPKTPYKIIHSKVASQSPENILNFRVGDSGSLRTSKPRVIIRKGKVPTEEDKQKVISKPGNTIITSTGKLIQATDKPKDEDALFDINSMPIVLSEEILTPENLDKMPIVMSDMPVTTMQSPKIIMSDVPGTKLQTTKIEAKSPTKVIESTSFIKDKLKSESPKPVEKYAAPIKKYGMDSKTSKVVMKPMMEKSVSPNILSKSPKMKSMKHLLVVDKTSGEQKLITPEGLKEIQAAHPTAKILHRTPNIISQTQKSEKFIILPSCTKMGGEVSKLTPTKISPTGSTKRIIVNSQTGKSQILLGESASSTSGQGRGKTPTAKIIQSRGVDNVGGGGGNTIMIITNAQGVQSKIVLTQEHQRILFPKKGSQQVVVTSQQPSLRAPSTTSSPPSLTPVSRPKSIAVTSQSIITSRGQILNPISGNALITSTGQLLPAQPSQSPLRIISKQKGNISSTSKIIPSGQRTILTGKPNQTILTSKGQLITTQSSPITSQSKLLPEVTRVTTTTASPQTTGKTLITQKLLGKPKQGLLKVPSKMDKPIVSSSQPTVILKSGGKLIGSDPASILQGKKAGTVMHLTAAQFEHLQKTGQIIQQSPISQVISSGKGKESPGKVQKFILQKYASGSKQVPPLLSEKKHEPIGIKHKLGQADLPQTQNRGQTLISQGAPPAKKQKLRELLSMGVDPPVKKRQVTYPSPSLKATTASASAQYKMTEQQVMDLGNLDELIPATTISTCKGQVCTTDNLQTSKPPPEEIITSQPPQVKSTVMETTTVQNEQQVSWVEGRVEEATPPTEVPPPPLGDGQLLAVPGENFGGPPNSFYLCMEENGTLTPIDNQPLVLENNQLVPMVLPAVVPEQQVIINAGDQQILVDQQTLLSLLGGGGGDRLVAGAGPGELLLQGDVRQLLAALAPPPQHNQDILAAALADTDVFQPETLVTDQPSAPPLLVEMDFQNLNTPVAVHSNVSETSTTLKQPIMSPVELPSKKRLSDEDRGKGRSAQNLEDTLAVIGVTPPSVPTSLDLPITVTDPRIAPKTTNPLSLSCGPLFTPSSPLDVFSTTAIQQQKTDIISEGSSLLTKVSESCVATKRKVHSAFDDILTDNLLNLPPRKKPSLNSISKTEDFNQLIKQPASSMPCLDDSSSDSFADDTPQQLTEAIQIKTYSPISMPLLTEDGPEDSVPAPVPLATEKSSSEEITPVLQDTPVTESSERVIQPDDSENMETTNQETKDPQTEVKSMPMLIDSDELVSDSTILQESTTECESSLSLVNDDKTFTPSIDMTEMPESVMEESNQIQCTETNFAPECSKESTFDEKIVSEPDHHIDTTNMLVQEHNECSEIVVPIDDQIPLEDKDISSEYSMQTDDIYQTIEQSDNVVNEDVVDQNELPPLTDESEAIDCHTPNPSDRDEMDMAPSSVPSEAACDSPLPPPPLPPLEDQEQGNSLQDHFNAVPSTPEAIGEEALHNFSDSSSDASTEIPIQPSISVSQRAVQNMSLINHNEEKNGHDEGNEINTEEESEHDLNRDVDSSPKRFKMDNEDER